jgi:phenylpyruvate tautomerase PptA (4-oxalocrotonate tautomerase family)
VEPQIVEILSKSLIDELQPYMSCPREDFTFEAIDTRFFHEGSASEAYPFVEVLWFDRGQEKQDAIAQVITLQVREALGEDLDVAVIFNALTPSAYYDNGEHY